MLKCHNLWISHWALALVRKWETAQGKEKIFDLSGNQTYDHRIWLSVALATKLQGQTGVDTPWVN